MPAFRGCYRCCVAWLFIRQGQGGQGKECSLDVCPRVLDVCVPCSWIAYPRFLDVAVCLSWMWLSSVSWMLVSACSLGLVWHVCDGWKYACVSWICWVAVFDLPCLRFWALKVATHTHTYTYIHVAITYYYIHTYTYNIITHIINNQKCSAYWPKKFCSTLQGVKKANNILLQLKPNDVEIQEQILSIQKYEFCSKQIYVWNLMITNFFHLKI